MKLNNFLLFFIISFQINFLFSSEGGPRRVGGPGDVKRDMADIKGSVEGSENQVMWVQTSDAERPIAIPLEVAKLSSLLSTDLEESQEPSSEKRPYLLPKASLITKAALELFLEISNFLIDAKKYGEDIHYKIKYFYRARKFLIEKLDSRAIEISTIFNLFNVAAFLNIPILMTFLNENISEILANPIGVDYILKNINNLIINLDPKAEFELKKQLFGRFPALQYEIKIEDQARSNKYIAVNSDNRFQAEYNPQTKKVIIYQIIDENNKQKIGESPYIHPILIKFEWSDLNLEIIHKYEGVFYKSIITLFDDAIIQKAKLNELLLIDVLKAWQESRRLFYYFIEQNREKILEVIRNFTSFKNLKYEFIKSFRLADDIKKIKDEDKAKEEAEVEAKQKALTPAERAAAFIYRLLYK